MVVDDDDHVDEVGDAADRLRDEQLLLEGRDDDRDALALDHERESLGRCCSAPAAEPWVGDDRGERAEQEARERADDGRVARLVAEVRTATAGCTTRESSTFFASESSCSARVAARCTAARRDSAALTVRFELAETSSFSPSERLLLAEREALLPCSPFAIRASMSASCSSSSAICCSRRFIFCLM